MQPILQENYSLFSTKCSAYLKTFQGGWVSLGSTYTRGWASHWSTMGVQMGWVGKKGPKSMYVIYGRPNIMYFQKLLKQDRLVDVSCLRFSLISCNCKFSRLDPCLKNRVCSTH